MSCITDHPSSRRGSAVLMVLVFIMLAAWMLLQILERVRAEMAARGSQSQQYLVRSTAFQALEIVIGVLAEIRTLDGGLYSPAQGWDDPFGYAGFERPDTDADGLDTGPDRITVHGGPGLPDIADFAFPSGFVVEADIRDESGLLPLNHTSEERWKILFEEMEISPAELNVLAHSLLDWIDADDEPRLYGAEAETYLRRDPPYRPSNAPLNDLRHLCLIDGFDRLFFDAYGVPNDLFRLFQNHVTAKSPGPVNLNSAPPLVLEVLARDMDFEARRVTEYLLGPDGKPGTRDDRILRPGLEAPDLPRDNSGRPMDFSATSRYLRVLITVRSADMVYRLSAWLDTAEADEKDLYPFRIVDLQTMGYDL